MDISINDIEVDYVKIVHVSEREKDVISLSKTGKVAKEIGNILCISSRTVEQHLKNLKNKYEALNMAHLIYLISRDNKELLASLFIVFQLASVINVDEFDKRKRKTGSRTVRISKVQKVSSRDLKLIA